MLKIKNFFLDSVGFFIAAGGIILFFIGIFGFDHKMKQLRGGISGTCPGCGQAAFFTLMVNYDYFHFFFLPLIKYHRQYIAVCGGCGAVCQVEESVAKEIAAGQRASFRPGELRLLRRAAPPSGQCPYCGHPNPPGSAYCNRCGQRI